jgi:predicted DNA-binding protein (MmcQ/YjbR family)
MHIEELREYCLGKKGVTESFPFGEDTLVFKVLNKLFALTSLNEKPMRVNLKCDPEWAVELREKYVAVQPGFHMNKMHWNTIDFENPEIPQKLLLELIDHSYDLVVKKMTKKEREKLLEL